VCWGRGLGYNLSNPAKPEKFSLCLDLEEKISFPDRHWLKLAGQEMNPYQVISQEYGPFLNSRLIEFCQFSDWKDLFDQEA